MKRFSILVVAGVLLAAPLLFAAPKYAKVLKQWTRDAQVYDWDNFEARLVWHATYLSPELREARRAKLVELYEWSPEELTRHIREDDDEARRNDVFFLAIYAGSSKLPEVGKEARNWRLVLDQDGVSPVAVDGLESIPVTQVDRILYPFLDKWSKAYIVRFPKTLRAGVPFRLRMTGIPAKSELVWKD